MLSHISQLRFAPTLVPTLAAVATIVLTVYLGHWQQGRAAEKEFLQAELEAREREDRLVLAASTINADLRFRRAEARGVWQASGQIYVDNKVDSGVAGYHVITPMKLDGTNSFVLVNRGWIARDRGYPAPPVAAVPAGAAVLAGVLVQPTSRFLELSSQSVQGSVWQNLTVERYRSATGLDVLPFVLVVDHAEAPLRDVTVRPDAGADKHIEYMLTWYALAATVLVLWIAMNTRFPAPRGETMDEPGRDKRGAK